MYTCPVCGYAALKYPPEDFTICPSCGSRVIERPAGWDGLSQLQSAGPISVQEVSVQG